ncbi:hypothetical protein [Variovorax sp. 770b2]|uniref:hypothetical protein n=1 Tax=Variovorax sp. 770b2 TaxID=1566271 RepID=UPI0008E31B8F|nr:hypothetical protein [Variovorax sp. 770b2]SFQ36978.1 hypothetical protein SAMN03159339_0091 [Variovorax sp. 770b2]
MSTGTQDVLRRIAVHVEEAPSGGFEWVLSEADDDEDEGPWRSLKRARKAAHTYKASMADGLLALQSLIDDLDAGPRRPTGAEPDSTTVRAGKEQARRAAKPGSEKKPATGSAFGFGLMK